MIDPKVAAIHALAGATGIEYSEMKRRVDFLEANEPAFDVVAEAQKITGVSEMIEEMRK